MLKIPNLCLHICFSADMLNCKAQSLPRCAKIFQKPIIDAGKLDVNLLETIMHDIMLTYHLFKNRVKEFKNHENAKIKLVRQIKSMIHQINEDIELEAKGRNQRHSFDVEYKVRDHVKTMLKGVLKSKKDFQQHFRIESERSIESIFRKFCRPDFELMHKT